LSYVNTWHRRITVLKALSAFEFSLSAIGRSANHLGDDLKVQSSPYHQETLCINSRTHAAACALADPLVASPNWPPPAPWSRPGRPPCGRSKLLRLRQARPPHRPSS
jgi:hypothetical protein